MKQPDYTSAIAQALNIATDGTEFGDKLNHIIRTTAETLGGGASLIMLDSTRTRLIHSSSFRLPKYYLQKGPLDREKSLDELNSNRTVVINDIRSDSRIQFRELAERALITAIAGVPVRIKGRAIGSLRIYYKASRTFSSADITFIEQIARIISLLFLSEIEPAPPSQNHPVAGALHHVQAPDFAHPSEAEFAGLLDFYNIEWVYEPRSFVLEKAGNRVTEMFSPDFYLPALDLYIELTTLKQSLITYKNRKIRRLRELYPEIKITLLNKNNYDRLLAKYGSGPLGQSRAHGIRQVLYTQEQIKGRVDELAREISADYANKCPVLLGVQRGFICFMADLIRQISVPMDMDFMALSHYTGKPGKGVKITKDTDLELEGRHVLLVEDIVDTGMTLSYILNHLKGRHPSSLEVCTLLDRQARRLVDVDIRYIGFNIPDEFVVGYGLDYQEEYRNLPFIGVPVILSDTSPLVKETQ
ncbi:MAG: hypoxanthine phosphoribosyltransferase [Dehalococcoidaceae bacterium]|nr:hypoxanthine phosphoribosyltransferase [Dehalococcoidaceae bacterium]